MDDASPMHHFINNEAWITAETLISRRMTTTSRGRRPRRPRLSLCSTRSRWTNVTRSRRRPDCRPQIKSTTVSRLNGLSLNSRLISSDCSSWARIFRSSSRCRTGSSRLGTDCRRTEFRRPGLDARKVLKVTKIATNSIQPKLNLRN